MYAISFSTGSKRRRTETKTLKDYHVTVTTAAENSMYEDDSSKKKYWEEHANYPILDAIIVSLSTRFSEESLNIAIAVDELFKLNFQQSSFLINYYKVHCNLYLSNIYKL